MQLKFITKTPEQTIELGRKIIKNLTAPVTILLVGDLASGKTTITKGFAIEKGIKDVINSPSFTIMKEYITDKNEAFHHYDFYRMDDVGNDFDLLDYLEYGYNIIEWPYQAKDLITNKPLIIEFFKNEKNDDERIIKVYSENEKLMEAIKNV